MVYVTSDIVNSSTNRLVSKLKLIPFAGAISTSSLISPSVWKPFISCNTKSLIVILTSVASGLRPNAVIVPVDSSNPGSAIAFLARTFLPYSLNKAPAVYSVLSLKSAANANVPVTSLFKFLTHIKLF